MVKVRRLDYTRDQKGNDNSRDNSDDGYDSWWWRRWEKTPKATHLRPPNERLASLSPLYHHLILGREGGEVLKCPL